MSHGHFLRALKEYGVKGTFEKLYKMRTIKFGKLIGTDVYGNKYFENTKDYPNNQHRWVEYAGWKNFYEVDASFVPPEWHGWLHHTTAEPPTATTVGSTHRYKPLANAAGSSAPYERSLGGIVTPPTPNLSQFRPRGYGLANGHFPESVPNEELYYTQPGWPLDKRNARVRASPRAGRRLPFTLRDTPGSIKTRAAVRLGLTVADLDRYSDPFSPSRVAMMTGVAETIGAGGVGGSAEDVAAAAALAEALPGAELPADARTRAVAARLASGDGFGPVGSELVPSGTFAAAVADTLTADELAFLSAGHDAAALAASIAELTDMVERYQGVAGKDAARGVERATTARAEAAATLERLRHIQAKLALLEADFESRTQQQITADAAAGSGAAAQQLQ